MAIYPKTNKNVPTGASWELSAEDWNALYTLANTTLADRIAALEAIVFATTTLITQTEVLLSHTTYTALPTTPMVGRLTIEVQNNGPNAILVGSENAEMLRVIQPGEAWSLDYQGVLYGKALTATQLTGAATIVTEAK